MRKVALFLSVAGALALTAQTTFALEVITLRSSSTRTQGDVTEITKSEVTVKPRTGNPIKIPANDIVQIVWTGEPTTLSLARNDENGGRFERALDNYNKILSELKTDSAGLKTDLQYFIARTHAKMAMANPATLDDAIKRLREFISSNGDSYHYYDAHKLLGDLNQKKSDPAAAKAAYETLGEAPFNDYKMMSKIALARQSLLENNITAAQSAFEAVTKMPASTPTEEARVQEAKLGIAHCLQLQKNYTKAAELLDEVIVATAPEERRVQAEAYLRQGDCLQAAGKPKEALLSYLHVDVLFPSDPDLHAESLFHLSKLWNTVQQPDRAVDAADRLTNEYPNSEWAKKLQAPAAE